MPRHQVLRGALAVVVVVSTIFAQQHAKKTDRDQISPGKRVLWMNPGNVARMNFKYGVGGAHRQPQPPFRFIKEDSSGSTAKVFVMDSRGLTWNLKWGSEARPTTFCTRLAWACGYFASAEYFMSQGKIDNVHGLTRASSRISRDGSFENARFQLRPDSPKFLKDSKWKWDENPFLGSHEMQGLKLLTVLVSNADAKNSNLGVFMDDEAGKPVYRYAVIDWGFTLGKWGNAFTHTMWDCDGFSDQTRKFIKGVENGRVRFDYSAKRDGDLSDDISVSDVQWLMQYLGKITDAQLRAGLTASGATPDETECFTRSLRDRIEQLRQVAGEPAARAKTGQLMMTGLLQILRDPRGLIRGQTPNF